MYELDFTPRRVCPRNIHVAVSDDGTTIERVEFTGGCNGNLKAIGRLVEGRPAKEIADILRGNKCNFKSTSCADQFAHAIDEKIG